MTRNLALLSALLMLPAVALAPRGARAADPVRIGITTILSGPYADRGQSEQYGAQLALDEINQAGGVLGRPVEAFYADNACKPEVGVPAVRKLLDEQHVPVVIGALCTPVTHAIMPLMQEKKISLVIATSAGQDFVDASGAGGNDYAFKTIPSEVDIARALVRWLGAQHVKSIAIVAEAGDFPQASAVAMEKAAADAGMKVTDQIVIKPGTTDFAPVMDTLKAGAPDRIWAMPGGSTGAFFKAYEAAGLRIPVTGRLDIGAALGAVSAGFKQEGGLADLTSITVFTPLVDSPGVRDFVQSYQAHYQIMPTQRSYFVYEATYLVVDAIRRAGSDQPAAIEQALKTTSMASRLGGSYAPDDHNHAHMPLFIVGLRDGKPAVVATEK